MPTPDRTTPAARAVADSLAADERSAASVAETIGMLPGHLSMIRNGAAAVPVERCGALARALGIDPARMLALCVESYRDHRSWRAIALATGI